MIGLITVPDVALESAPHAVPGSVSTIKKGGRGRNSKREGKGGGKKGDMIKIKNGESEFPHPQN